MPCVAGTTPEGHAYFACSRGPAAACDFCRRSHVALCDYPAPERKSGTCDKRMCAQHRHARGRNRDFCPDHARVSAAVPVAPVRP